MISELDGVIREELKGLPENFMVSVLIKSDQYATVNSELLNYLVTQRKMAGIYVSLNEPHTVLEKQFQQQKIDIKNVFFIDAISGTIQKTPEETQGHVVVSGPTALTDIAIAISKILEQKKLDFIYLDSLSALLFYNTLESSTKFTHFLANKIKTLGLSGVILSVEEETAQKIIESISQFCDKVIKMEAPKLSLRKLEEEGLIKKAKGK